VYATSTSTTHFNVVNQEQKHYNHLGKQTRPTLLPEPTHWKNRLRKFENNNADV